MELFSVGLGWGSMGLRGQGPTEAPSPVTAIGTSGHSVKHCAVASRVGTEGISVRWAVACGISERRSGQCFIRPGCTHPHRSPALGLPMGRHATGSVPH